MSGRKDWIKGHKCRQCGKRFEVVYPDLWAFKLHEHDASMIWFCGYSCKQAYLRDKEARSARMQRERRRIQKEMGG